MTGADLSGMRFSTEPSSVPRGMWTAPGMAPCSYSSGSRTSSTTAPGRRRSSSAAAVSTSRICGLGGGEQLTEARHRAPSRGSAAVVAAEKPSDQINNPARPGVPGRGLPPAARSGLDRDLVHGLDEVAGVEFGAPPAARRRTSSPPITANDTALPTSRATSTRKNRSSDAIGTVTARARQPRPPADRLVDVPAEGDQGLGAGHGQHVEAGAGGQQAHHQGIEVGARGT